MSFFPVLVRENAVHERAWDSLCAVGVAFDAQIGGIRMLDGQVYCELQN